MWFSFYFIRISPNGLIYKVNISILKHFPFQSYSKNTPKAHKKSNLGTQKLVQLNK